MSENPVLTLARTFGRGDLVRQGDERSYYRLAYGPGEPRVRRLELAPDELVPSRRQSLLHFAHLTDLHTVDPQSPGRYEFVERFYDGQVAYLLIMPAQRPHEMLNLHAAEAMIRTINDLDASPETGAPIQFLMSTGDNIDSMQANELQMFIDLMKGMVVTCNSGGPTYEGVQSLDWDDPYYWHPDPYPDHWKARFGFPEYPGLIEEAIRPFQAQGLRLPWLSCYGNHDALVLGAGIPNPVFEEWLTGPRKVTLLPPEFHPMEHLDGFIPHPESYLVGPTRSVTHDPARCTARRRDYVVAHVESAGEPRGHGFNPDNVTQNTAYYVYDPSPHVRMIVLDTTDPRGHYRGSIGVAQLRWLEERLIEVHSRSFDPTGRLVTTGNDDRLVILCSHDPLATLANPLTTIFNIDGDAGDLPRVLGPELESLLHRFPNVILWVNGHIHRNLIRPRPDPTGRTHGFWEVTTASIIDWPSQARLIEIASNGNGTLSIFGTMIDHAAPADPRSADGIDRLAAIHREIASNDPHSSIERGFHGAVTDRNVELMIPAPF